MEELSQYACKVANKVALAMSYGETIGERAPARKMVQDALDATCDLLDRINPVELRDWFEQLESVYRKVQTDLVSDPAQWSRFLGSQCELLHQVKLHQKTIAHIGDRMAQWDRNSISFDEFGFGLDGLSGLVSEHAVLLGQAIEREAGRDANRIRRAESFTNSVCGLAVVLVAIRQAILVGDPRDRDCAALATFGASLNVTSVRQLFTASEFNRTQ